jgi:adenylate cyclase
MSDVFISYAREDEAQAKALAEALRAQGYRAWRDDELPAHRTYAEVIEERLNSAEAVVVLWSADARTSQWVRAEADTARNRGTLIQVSLDGTIPPIPFNQIQCADLNGCESPLTAPGWAKLVGSLEALAGVGTHADERQPKDHRGGVSICVLPFANMSGDAEQEYFSDGISEDITTDLSKVSALAVTARNTAFMFKGRSVRVPEVAKELGVSHVLEGSVRKAGARVRITAQLIDGKTGDHLWADRYDRDLDDIFAIQDEISKAIVEALKVKLLPEEQKAIENRGTTNVEAYDFYLLARQTWIGGTHGDIRREETVVRFCDRAIEIQQDYAQAWALKALAQAAIFFGYNKGSENGVAAAERSLELNPSLPEAYCVKARALSHQRKLQEAEEQIRIALDLAPDLWEANNEAALLYYWGNRFPEAAHYYENCARLIEGDRHSLEMLMSIYAALDDTVRLRSAAERLLEASETAIAENPNQAAPFGSGSNALAMLGDIDRAKEWIDRALLIEPDNLNIRYNFVCTLLRSADNVEVALDHLDYVFARSVGSIVRRADLDPDLEPVRDHPRFKKIYAAAMERIARLDAEAAQQAKG